MDKSGILRAYAGLENFEGILDHVGVKFSTRVGVNFDPLITLDEADYLNVSASLEIDFSSSETSNSLDDACKVSRLNVDQIDLLVRVRCPIGKRSGVVFKEPLSVVAAKAFSIPMFPNLVDVPLASGVDVAVEVTLVLNSELPDNYPCPYRLGTWLVSRTIQIVGSKAELAGFEWNPMTATDRQQLGIHSRSSIFVKHLQGLHEAEKLQDVVEVWVEEELLNQMKNDLNQKHREFLQTRLVEEVVSQVLMRCIIKLREEYPSGVNVIQLESMPLLFQVLNSLASRNFADSRNFSAGELLSALESNPELTFEYCSELFDMKRAYAQIKSEESEVL